MNLRENVQLHSEDLTEYIYGYDIRGKAISQNSKNCLPKFSATHKLHIVQDMCNTGQVEATHIQAQCRKIYFLTLIFRIMVLWYFLKN